VAHLDVRDLTYVLPDGRVLLDRVSFRVGEGVTAALVGPNGAGKTTLLRLLAGELHPTRGAVTSSGGRGYMSQFVGSRRDEGTVRDLLLSVAPVDVRTAASTLAAAEEAMAAQGDERSQMAYAEALVGFSDAGGYEIEVTWDRCTHAAMGTTYDRVRDRPVTSLSGGEQKRLVLEALINGPDEVLLLDEPDNYLDVPGKEWLAERLGATPKTVLLVSHDRQLLADAADRIVTVEERTAWVHGGGFASYAEARAERLARLDERRRRWDEEHARLRHLVSTLRQRARISDDVASAYRSARSRLERFEEAGPPLRPPRPQNVRMRLRGGRTGKRAVRCERLGMPGLVAPFDLEIDFGERVAVLGANGTGKTRFLRLLGGGPEADAVHHTGEVWLGAGVVPGLFDQTHRRPDLTGRSPVDVITGANELDRNGAMAALARYELAPAGRQPFETLSGGQQARLQILLLELSGATLLLLDEPTDNLDLASAEALDAGLAGYEGTVVTVTHDRWFTSGFDRFVVFQADGSVVERDEPTWHDDSMARGVRGQVGRAEEDTR
jgi:ATPase subunit of ABC transporter with duplicated ATPase domains